MQLNPILQHELRARWRGWGSFALAFGFTAVLCLVFAINYSAEVGYYYEETGSWAIRPGDQAIIGHDLFSYILVAQVAAWLLIAPALTAGGIAGERESGMLEAIQLTPLRTWSIVSGKLVSAVLYMGLMLLLAVPITATCFVLGGVAPNELWQGIALQCATALACGCIGLLFSAGARRAGHAIAGAEITVVAWVFISGAPFIVGGSPAMRGAWSPLLDVLAATNPFFAANCVFDPDAVRIAPRLPWSPLVIIFAMDAIVCLACLMLAARAVRRPLAEQGMVETRLPRWREHGNTQDSDCALTASHDDDFSRQSNHRARAEPALAASLSFSNPVLLRELRGKLRQPRPTPAGSALLILLGLLLCVGYAAALWYCWWDENAYVGIYTSLGILIVVGLVIAAPLMGANAFAREREAGTWQALDLSLLTRREIISGKLNTILITCWAFAALLLPIFFRCVGSALPRSPFFDRYGYPAPSAIDVLADFLWVFSVTWFLALWGMVVSWHSRRTTTSIVATLISLFLAVIAFSMLVDLFQTAYPGLFGGDIDDHYANYSPPGNYDHVISALELALGFAIGSLLLLALLHYCMKRTARPPLGNSHPG